MSDEDDIDGYNTDTEQKKKKKLYLHKFRKEWLQMPDFKNWIAPSQKGPNYFSCKLCNEDYAAGIAAVKKHHSTSKHRARLKSTKNQQVIHNLLDVSKSKEKKIKEIEIKIASFIVDHNIAISFVDHLVQLIVHINKHSDVVKDITCNRSKCTALINNVVGMTSFEKLKAKIIANKFSLIVDESTDHSCTKHLAIVVRTNVDFVIQDEFLTLVPVAQATAENLHRIIVDFFKKHSIPYKKNLIGMAADGANTMMGVRNSLQMLFKNDIPNLFVMKCVCHSMALCASYACSKLPDNVEKLIRNIYNYMQHSFKRQYEYREFQKFVEIKPHKLLQPSQTRWLSHIAVVKRVLEQYNALVLYFQSQNLNDNVENAGVILNNLNPINKAYLEFLEYFLPIFYDLNLEFQSESPKIHLLYNKMASAYKTIIECYIKPDYLRKTEIQNVQFRNPQNYKPLENVYYGAKAVLFLERKDILHAEKHSFRLNCLDFLVESAAQIYKRFPFNSEQISGLKYLSFIDPKSGLSIETLVPLIQNLKLDYDVINLDREWRLLKNTEIIYSEGNIFEYWRNVSEMQKGDGTQLYPLLTNLVSYIFTLPHSSACVERVFSQINLNKTKVRNRLETKTLSGILHSKRLIGSNNNKCYNLNVDAELIKRHNITMYNKDYIEDNV